jgi:hypothetical protein
LNKTISLRKYFLRIFLHFISLFFNFFCRWSKQKETIMKNIYFLFNKIVIGVYFVINSPSILKCFLWVSGTCIVFFSIFIILNEVEIEWHFINNPYDFSTEIMLEYYRNLEINELFRIFSHNLMIMCIIIVNCFNGEELLGFGMKSGSQLWFIALQTGRVTVIYVITKLLTCLKGYETDKWKIKNWR